VTLLDDSDPRSEVVEAFVAKNIDAKSCQLGTGAASPAVTAKSIAPVAPAKVDPQPSPEPPPAPKRSGCSGCATSEQDAPGGLVLAVVGGALLLGRRRVKSQARRRRSSAR
jgi:uncharacterized protein (TIGR03382 family)